MAMTVFRVELDKLKGNIGQFNNIILNLLRSARDRMNAHILEKGNVHGLEPRDIGLGNVPDWLPAQQAQAKGGTNNSSFMTPKRVDNYAEENIFKAIEKVFNDAYDRL
ncbi:minor tail protein [Pseudomonas phage vB_PaeM_PS119XW]|uniref:Minor tail protein n=1 Tax=Pseudomonas phage vB_PaeM_PS119XW TaxID=2601632 RepID=A0A5C1K7L2_9CAUD|nr:tail protein [Pseudomonas phage vB_PaeM_PS119XW]QEM41885.1 minor tail protein [Pseudomonas phage vB_PaeM_PS119XW]BEG72400.1 hypothetical protein RVBP21_0280 [Pseudomonas phage BRkr]